MDGHESRKSPRYTCQVPIKLKEGTGMTRNCSVDGVYFTTHLSLSIGEQIEFEMVLNDHGLGQSVRLQCRANVIRVEQMQDRTGVAATFTKQRFVEPVGSGLNNNVY